MGSLLGLVVGPIIINVTERYALREGLQPLALPWFCLPALIIAGMCLIYFVRPDPKEIGMNLAKYYPGYVPPPRRAGNEDDTHFDGWSLMRNPRIRLAIVANCAAQGNMSIVMVLTSLVLHFHGHSLGEIAIAHMFHSAGMLDRKSTRLNSSHT